jgi:hypothetical protein
LVSWDTEALRIPATAYAPTLAVIFPMRTRGQEETDDETKINLPLLGTVMLILIPLCVIIKYIHTTHIQQKAEILTTLTVTSSDSPKYEHEVSESGSRHERYVLKAQELNCHFWITGEPLDIVKNNRKTKELLESIQRHDKLTLVISKKDENQLGSLYFKARLFGLSKHDDILFSPEQLKILQKDYMNTTFVVATILEIIIFLGLMWRRIRMKGTKQYLKERTRDLSEKNYL